MMHTHIHIPEWRDDSWAVVSIVVEQAACRPGAVAVVCEAPCFIAIGVHPSFAPPKAEVK